MSRDLFRNISDHLNVLTFPADDLVLRRRVVDEVKGAPATDARRTRERLQGRLRAVYPRVEVRIRDPLAGYGEPTLYVFRDGGIVSTLGSQSWVEDAGTARLVTDPSGNYIEANQSAADLFGVGVEDIIGSPAGTFTEADARITDPSGLWASLETAGELHSLAVVRRSDGPARVEFMTRKNADGMGRHVTWLRRYG